MFFPDGRPLGERKYLALGETPERIELLDGGLFLLPAPDPRHQLICGALAEALSAPPEQWAHRAVNVRLGPDRIAIPDLIVTGRIDFDAAVVEATSVRLVCEVVSPASAVVDRILKMHSYATAGIPWYLLIDQETGSSQLHQLEKDAYVEQSATKGAGPH